MLALIFLHFLLCIASISSAAPLLSTRDICLGLTGQVSQTFQCKSFVESYDVPSAKLSIWGSAEIPADSIYLKAAQDAVQKSMTTYSPFLDGKSFEIRVFLVKALTDGQVNALAETKFPTDITLNTCRTQIVVQNSKTQDKDILSFQTTIAHEIYHCVQFAVGQASYPVTSRWWKEGTAEYFANTIYPKDPESSIPIYYPLYALYQMGDSRFNSVNNNLGDNGDSVAIFFQYLSNSGWSPRKIHDFMASQEYTKNFPDELSRISLDTTGLADLFPSFASQFVDDAIIDVDKSTKIQSEYSSNVLFPPLAVPVGSTDEKFLILPWNIESGASATFKDGQSASIQFTVTDPADQRTILQYRRSADSTWLVLKAGESADLKPASPSSCTEPNEWLFLMTSTFDPKLGTFYQDGQSHAIISFTVADTPIKRADSCQSTSSCLVGNWALDIPSLQAYFVQVMSGASTAAITNLVVGGSSTFNVTDSLFSTMDFNHLTIGYDGSASEISFHTDIDIDGSVTGQLTNVNSANSTSSSFTWTQPVSTGTAQTTTTVMGQALPLDIDFSGQYGSSTDVQYVCSGTSLKMSGYVAGKYAWAYTWIKA